VLKSTITDIDYINHRITFDELPFEEKVFINIKSIIKIIVAII
jgi:hypothetical protein